jgi:ubiquitin carboxyl-terminal hydrolase 4/11/15
MESITEIREDGNIVTVESTMSLDGDIADEKGMLVDDDRELRRVGVKQDLFTLRLQSNHRDYGTSFNGYSSYSSAGQWITWEDRLQEADTHPSLLRDNDAFFCEFDEDKKTYYFGDGPRAEHARWDNWEIFIHPELEEARKAAAEKSHKAITLQDCLEEFTKQEKLGEDDLWYCPQCKKHQQATKQFDLWKAPDILVVHLKRFSNNRTFRDKIDTHIDFPIEGLDLTDMVKERAAAKKLLDRGVDIESLGLDNLDKPLIYDLYAVDEHLGGLGGGHYRAYAANHMNGKWYHFDDSYVTPAHASDSVVSYNSN